MISSLKTLKKKELCSHQLIAPIKGIIKTILDEKENNKNKKQTLINRTTRF